MKDQQHGSKTTHTCAYCDKQFKYKSEKERHEQSHSPQFECDVCAKKFSFLSALRRHQKQHRRTGSVQCEKCDRKFRDETLLQRHKKYAHTGSFVCNDCHIKFSSQLALQSHMKTHKPVSERKYQCSFEGCGKAFNYLHHLNHHELTHTNSKQHFCKICGRGFIQLHHLKRHLISHEPESWLCCTSPGCKKKFITEFARKKHIASHNNNTVRAKSDSSDVDNKTPKNSTRDNVLCTSCGKTVLKGQFLTHKKKCLPKQDTTQKYCTVYPVKKENADIITVPKQDTLEVDTDEEISEDESIITKDSDDSRKEDDFNKITELMSQNKMKNNLVKYPKKVKQFLTLVPDSRPCAGCKCPSNITSKQFITNPLKINYNDKNMPVIEYRLDGVVKIKETFDFEIEETIKIEAKDEKAGEKLNTSSETKFLPFNSCKAVLGNCIVSGNDTMGDGCFCAKMIDDDQATMQEMEEITPIGLI